MHSELLSAAKADLVLAFASQKLSARSEASASANSKASAGSSRKERTALLVEKKASVWNTFLELDATQILLVHDSHAIFTRFHDYCVYEMSRYRSSNMRALLLQSQ